MIDYEVVYPYFLNARVHITPREIWFDRKVRMRGVSAGSSMVLNDDAFRIVELCDGTKSIHEISRELSGKQDDVGGNSEIIHGMLSEVHESFGMRLTAKPQSQAIPVYGSSKCFIPSHISIEVTSKCNLKCRYCYNNSGPEELGYLENLTDIMGYLGEAGVSIVEITGGEPFLHPNIEEGIELACELFDSVAIITNGTIWSERVGKLLRKYSDKLLLQISLDADNRESFKEITGVDCYDEVASNLVKFAATGCMTRVAVTIDSRESVSMFEGIVNLAKSSGIDYVAISTPIQVGRADERRICSSCNMEEHFVGEKCQVLKINKAINECENKYPNYVVNDPTGQAQEALKNDINCGGGHRNLTVDSKGNIMMCVVQGSFDYSIGRLDMNKPPHEVFDQKILKMFAGLVPPGGSLCENCELGLNCVNCYIDTIKKIGDKDKKKCPWYQKYSKNEEFVSYFEAIRAG